MLARVEALSRHALPSVPAISAERGEELYRRALRLERAGDLAAASAVLRRASKAPSHAGIALMHRGRIERRRGRTEEAMAIYKQALHHLTDRRDTAWVYAEIGQLYFAMREDEEAEYYFRRAASADPSMAGLLERTRRDVAHPDLHRLDTSDLDIVTLQ